MSDEGATEAPVAASDLPLSLTVTRAVQDVIVAAGTRSFAGLVLLPLLGTVGVLGTLAIAAGAAPVALVAVPTAAGYGIFACGRLRVLIRRVFPVGRVLGAEVTSEHLAVAVPGGVEARPWSCYSKIRVTSDAVLLRVHSTKRKRIMTQVLPRALFGPADLSLLESSVPPWR